MSDEFGPAIAALERKLSEQQRTVLETKRSINLLLKMAGGNPQYAEEEEASTSVLRQDQYYGKSVTGAAAEYLAMRKQACQPEEILRGLETGGFDFDMLTWEKNDRLRSFAIALSRNTGTGAKFHRLKNGSFGLRGWYDEEFLKKAAEGADATANAKKQKASKKAAKAKKAKLPDSAPVPPASKKSEAEKPKSSAKEKSRPAADQTAQTGGTEK
jgi:hypothetical protein